MKHIYITLLIIIACIASLSAAPTQKQDALLQAITDKNKSLETSLVDALAKSAETQAALDDSNTELTLQAEQLTDASAQIATDASTIKKQEDENAKLVQDVAYWKEKQEKALKELWFWRSIAIGIVALVTLYILAKLGILGAKVQF
jgi:hypothetical protein